MARGRGAAVATKTLEISGGSKLAKKLAEIAAQLGDGAQLSVGFLEGATYPTVGDSAGLSVAQVAFWNEYGTRPRSGGGVDSMGGGGGIDDLATAGPRAGGIPSRPFFRSMIAKNSRSWPDTLGAAVKASKYNARRALTIQGTVMKDQLVTSIVETTTPPNAPSTIARKGFDKPLIDTGVMQRSVDFVVKA